MGMFEQIRYGHVRTFLGQWRDEEILDSQYSLGVTLP